MNTQSPVLPASSLPTPDTLIAEFSVPELPSTQTGGFTLARLLMVIAVVGTLSALAAPMLFPGQP